MKSVEAKQGESGSSRYTVFTLSDQYFALEISYIREVIEFPKLTRLPNRQAYFTGTFNLRGKIVTIVDIRYLLNLEILKREEPGRVILTEFNQLLVGISVDKVLDFINVEELKIQLPSRKTPSAIANHITGFLEKENFGSIYLLDINKLITALS